MHLFKARIFIFIALCFPFLASASWPIFDAPNFQFIINNNLLDQNGCAPGQGKIISADINIRENFCRSYCPNAWNWTISSDSACHLIDDSLTEQFKIEYIIDEYGTTNYSEITVKYFDSNQLEIIRAVMKTPLNEHWYCRALTENQNSFSCANDI